MPLVRIEWRDLLAAKFKAGGEDPATGIDCWSIARIIARRAGLFVPEWPAREHEDPRGALSPLLEYVGPTPSCARRIADLIVGDPEELGWPSHVASIVDERTQHALSISKRHGPYAFPAARHACQYGVWRPKMPLGIEEGS